MSNQSNASGEKPPTVQDILREIEQKSEVGGYIYRGERKCNPKVSSKLYRDFEIESEHFDIEVVQKEMLAAAKKHTGDLPQDFRLEVTTLPDVMAELIEEARDFEILTEIQHYGGKTNLIDFTTDYFIALFFACDGRYEEDGRVILQRIDQIKNMITHPRNPRHRVIAQKSVFIRPPRGFIEPHESDIVIIPANLKQSLLQHLRDYHGISTEVIYNDLHGFIRNQDIHGDAYTHFYRGFACQNRGDEAPTPKEMERKYDEAITHYTKAIELKPDLAEAYNNRGNAYADQGDFDSAISDYNIVIQLNPNYAEAYSNRGAAYYKKGDFDSAISDYNAAIQLNPNYAEAYYNRGAAYYKKGDFDSAISDYNAAIQLNPNYAEAHYNRGAAYASKGDFDSVISDCNAAIQLNPNYAEAYSNRGAAYASKGDFDSVISDCNAAIQLNPNYAEAYSNRSAAYASKGDFDSVISDCNTAIQLNPNYAEAYYNRGEAWLHLQEWDRARSDMRTVQNMGADITIGFRNDYANVADFEQKTGVQLPEDITEMLTPQEA